MDEPTHTSWGFVVDCILMLIIPDKLIPPLRMMSLPDMPNVTSCLCSQCTFPVMCNLEPILNLMVVDKESQFSDQSNYGELYQL